MIEKVYTSLIIKGNKKFFEVPSQLQDAVQAILIEMGREDLIIKQSQSKEISK